MRRFEIEIIIRSVKIGRHRGNKIVAVFARKCLAKFYAGDFRDRVSFVSRFERAAQQRAFGNRLRRELGINARAAEKQKFSRAVLMSSSNDVVLNAQVL